MFQKDREMDQYHSHILTLEHPQPGKFEIGLSSSLHLYQL